MANIKIKKAARVISKDTKVSAVDKAILLLETASPETEAVDLLLSKIFPDVKVSGGSFTNAYWWKGKVPKGSRIIVEHRHIATSGGYASISYPVDQQSTKRETVEASAKYMECAIIIAILKLHKRGVLCL